MAKFNNKYGAYDSNGDYQYLFVDSDPSVSLTNTEIAAWAQQLVGHHQWLDKLAIITSNASSEVKAKTLTKINSDNETEVENVKNAILVWLAEHKPKEPSTNEEYKTAIMSLVESNEPYVYAETHVGYHQKNELWGGMWQNRCYLQIAHPYDDPKRLYAKSYEQLYKIVKEYYNE